MYRLPSAARGSDSRVAGGSSAARDSSGSGGRSHLEVDDAQELLASVGFLLVPGPPFARGPAYLLIAVRPQPTLAHFDPERIVAWTQTPAGAEQTTLEWPLVQPVALYAWGTIEVVDRLAATNRFASFGGVLDIARDRNVHAALFRSDAPILSAGGHSGPPDLLGVEAVGFFGILRAAAGADAAIGAVIRRCSPVGLYAAFLTRLAVSCTSSGRTGRRDAGIATIVARERRRLQCEAPSDLQDGEAVAGLLTQRSSTDVS